MTVRAFLDGRVSLHAGDCLSVLAALKENSVDSCVCDPPYHLTSIIKRFAKTGGADRKPPKKDHQYRRLSTGFMGKRWDGVESPKLDAGIAHWLAGFADGEGCFTTRKSGAGYVCEFIIHVRADDAPVLRAIQEATGIGHIDGPRARADGTSPMVRWIVRRQADCAMLVQIFREFPLRAKKARDFEVWASAVDEWIKHEPGTSWEDLRSHADMLSAVKQFGATFNASQFFHFRWARQVFRVLKPGAYLLAFGGTRTFHRLASAIEDAGFEIRDQIGWAYGSGFPKSHNLGEGRGTALKPAWEPICLARKPLIGTNAENIARFGTGGLNIDECRVEGENTTTKNRTAGGRSREQYRTGTTFGGNVPTDHGRWPANLIHDGSDEVLAAFSEAPGQQREVNETFAPKTGTAVYGDYGPRPRVLPRDDGGSAARFFYTAKADAEDRIGSKHPTVKPLDLMQYLVRLVTPKGGLVLDCFAGTGTTGEAAWREGMRALLIEAEPEYQADIARRMELAENPTKRTAVAKSKNNLQGAEGTPLFDLSPTSGAA
jgi:site-specific DNA-methyltransferase (adenine-specific)